MPKTKVSQPKKVKLEKKEDEITPHALSYILSFVGYSYPKSQIDSIIFDQTKDTPSGKKIDLNKVVIDTPGKREIRTTYKPQDSLLLEDISAYTKKENDELKSGIAFGKTGISYNLVIPLADNKVINILKIGVEPNQVEDIRKTTVSPKAQIEVVVPLD